MEAAACFYEGLWAFVKGFRIRASCLRGLCCPAGKGDAALHLSGAVPWVTRRGDAWRADPQTSGSQRARPPPGPTGCQTGLSGVYQPLGRGVLPAAGEPALPWAPATSALPAALPSGQMSALQAASPIVPLLVDFSGDLGRREGEHVNFLPPSGTESSPHHFFFFIFYVIFKNIIFS